MTEKKRKDPKAKPIWWRLLLAVGTELVGVHPRLHAYNVAASLLPLTGSGELRALLLRRAGLKVGSGTRVEGPVTITGPHGLLRRLIIGADCFIAPDCVFELAELIVLGDRVTLEPGVMLLTSTHELDIPAHRAGPLVSKPLTIGHGVWLRARSIILPGVTIGDGAVVEAGAVVNKDVPPNVRVGGIPAVLLEQMKSGGDVDA